MHAPNHEVATVEISFLIGIQILEQSGTINLRFSVHIVIAFCFCSTFGFESAFRSISPLQLTPFYDTDFNLLRWLQGHDHNIDVVVPKLKHHLAMRKSCLQLDHLTDHGKKPTIKGVEGDRIV